MDGKYQAYVCSDLRNRTTLAIRVQSLQYARFKMLYLFFSLKIVNLLALILPTRALSPTSDPTTPAVNILARQTDLANLTSVSTALAIGRPQCFDHTTAYGPAYFEACSFALVKLLTRPNSMAYQTWTHGEILESSPCEILLIERTRGAGSDRFTLAEVGVQAASIIQICVLERRAIAERKGGFLTVGRRSRFQVVVASRTHGPIAEDEGISSI
ncbi:MAG: hypothetical protein Q9167_002008 [Letrouitia subvulpina]